jgi:probable addiction module antidote protein
MRKFKDDLHVRLQDKEYAMTYIDVALNDYAENKDTEAFLLALNDVVNANGGIGKLASNAKLSRPSLYKTLSGKTKPRFSTIISVLKNLGFSLHLTHSH